METLTVFISAEWYWDFLSSIGSSLPNLDNNLSVLSCQCSNSNVTYNIIILIGRGSVFLLHWQDVVLRSIHLSTLAACTRLM